MNGFLLVAGIVLGAGGAMILAFVYFFPQSVRRETRRVRDLTRRARDAGLRGRYRFVEDRSKWDSTGGFGTYEPADVEDSALFAAVGSRIESESGVFAREALWTDARLVWLGVPALLIGAATCAVAAFG